MKQASQDTRERAIAAHKNGKSIRDICALFGICRKTLYLWRKRDAEGGLQKPKPKGHAPRYLTDNDMKNIKILVENNKSITAREICQKLGFTCSHNVIYRALKKLNFTNKKNNKSKRA